MIPLATFSGWDLSAWAAGALAVLASLWKRKGYQEPFDELRGKLRRKWVMRHPLQAIKRRIKVD